MVAVAGKKYIGLSLSGCVYDIVKGVIKEEQVDRIIAGTMVHGFSVENERATERDNRLLKGILPVSNDFCDEMDERASRAGTYAFSTQHYADKIMDEFRYNLIVVVTDRSSWELMMDREVLWQQGAEFQAECIAVATRLIEAGKVDQPRLRGENAPRTASGRWVDCETGEIVHLLRESPKDKPDYLLRLLDLQDQCTDLTERASLHR